MAKEVLTVLYLYSVVSVCLTPCRAAGNLWPRVLCAATDAVGNVKTVALDQRPLWLQPDRKPLPWTRKDRGVFLPLRVHRCYGACFIE